MALIAAGCGSTCILRAESNWAYVRGRESAEMARHYSITSFFRQMPVRLLARYFHARGLLQDLDFSAMTGAKRDSLFAAWLDLERLGRIGGTCPYGNLFSVKN
jgi:hypothetical protein